MSTSSERFKGKAGKKGGMNTTNEESLLATLVDDLSSNKKDKGVGERDMSKLSF